jgi:SAM-dependent methyltransferase
MKKNKKISGWIDNQNIEHRGFLLSTKNNYEVITCETCGFSHAIPIPDAKTLNDFYVGKYYQKFKPNYAEQHANDRKWWDLVYRERCYRFEQLLGRVGKILDVGSGPGFFLSSSAEMGWDVTGIEPSEQASEYARGLGVKSVTDNFDARSAAELGQFDVIQINQAIEHIPNPATVIELCWSLLRPGGLICIVAANDFNPLQLVARELHGVSDWWVTPPEHVNYFNLTSLKNIVRRCGFEIVGNTATFPIDLFLLMGDNYIGEDSVGKICHQRRKNLEFAMANHELQSLKEKLYQSFAKLGLGREIEVIGKNLLNEKI